MSPYLDPVRRQQGRGVNPHGRWVCLICDRSGTGGAAAFSAHYARFHKGDNDE
jgi:hypothetical protein